MRAKINSSLLLFVLRILLNLFCSTMRKDIPDKRERIKLSVVTEERHLWSINFKIVYGKTEDYHL